MRQVIYCSKAAGPDADGHLTDIIGCSKRNNPELGITGVLIVIGETYLQLLEGPEESLGVLLDFIRTDCRHTGMEVLAERPMKDREFGDWAMGYHEITPSSALDTDVLEALEAARRERSVVTCDRLMDAVSDIGRVAKRRTRAAVEPRGRAVA